MTVNSINMSDQRNKDYFPIDKSQCTPEESGGIDEKKKLILEIGHTILREKLEQHSAEEQLRLIQFDDELHSRVEDHIATIQDLTKQLKEAYEAFITVGGNSDELAKLFDDFETSGIPIKEEEMFDADEG